jgi:transposase
MKILALDLAKSKSVALDMDTQSGEVEYQTIRTTPAEVQELLRKRRPDRVVLEIGAAAGWVHDLAASMGMAVQVANPNGEAWRWSGLKVKTDRKDVDKLAHLSWVNQLPLVHMPSPQVRQKRALIAYLRKVIQRRTAIQCQIHAILERQGLSCPSGKKTWGQENLKRLRELSRTLGETEELDLWRGQLDLELTALNQIEEQTLMVERKLNALGKQDPKVRLLRTIPGVGPRLSEALVAVIDDPHRFQSGKQVSSYLGMVPRLYESGQMSRNGHITRAGNAMLRGLLVEVSWLGLRWNPYLAEIYNRIRGGSKTRSKAAIVAVARHLLVIAWTMLRKNEPWREPKVPAARRDETASRMALAGQPPDA